MRFTRWGLLATATVLSAAACAPRDARPVGAAPIIIDDAGDTLSLGTPPRRVVSLNPATTEALFALGAGDRVVGRTHWDAWPPAAAQVPDMGDGMRPDVERVLGARPDLVVLYASASNRDAARALRRAGVATLTLRTDRVAHLRPMLVRLAQALGDSMRGVTVADSVERTLAAVRARPRPVPAPRVLWPFWLDPILVAGRGSFYADLLAVVGAENVFGDLDAPSPQVAIEAVLARDPDVILAGPRMRERMERDPRWRTLRAVRTGRILSPDTMLVGRPGVRLGEAAASLHALLGPPRP